MRSRGFHTHQHVLEAYEKMHPARKRMLDLTLQVAQEMMALPEHLQSKQHWEVHCASSAALREAVVHPSAGFDGEIDTLSHMVLHTCGIRNRRNPRKPTVKMPTRPTQQFKKKGRRAVEESKPTQLTQQSKKKRRRAEKEEKQNPLPELETTPNPAPEKPKKPAPGVWNEETERTRFKNSDVVYEVLHSNSSSTYQHYNNLSTLVHQISEWKFKGAFINSNFKQRLFENVVMAYCENHMDLNKMEVCKMTTNIGHLNMFNNRTNKRNESKTAADQYQEHMNAWDQFKQIKWLAMYSTEMKGLKSDLLEMGSETNEIANLYTCMQATGGEESELFSNDILFWILWQLHYVPNYEIVKEDLEAFKNDLDNDKEAISTCVSNTGACTYYTYGTDRELLKPARYAEARVRCEAKQKLKDSNFKPSKTFKDCFVIDSTKQEIYNHLLEFIDDFNQKFEDDDGKSELNPEINARVQQVLDAKPSLFLILLQDQWSYICRVYVFYRILITEKRIDLPEFYKEDYSESQYLEECRNNFEVLKKLKEGNPSWFEWDLYRNFDKSVASRFRIKLAF